LARKLNQIDDKMHDFENLLRQRGAGTSANAQGL
jgi:hypothetical protein